MFNPNEEIQIIGYDAGDLSAYERFELEQQLTKMNEELCLKNRYNKAIDKLERLRNKIQETLNFCEMEADGTTNDKHCRIAIRHYKSFLDIIDEKEGL